MTSHGGIAEMTGPGCTERTINYSHASNGRLTCECGRLWVRTRGGWNCAGINTTEEPW